MEASFLEIYNEEIRDLLATEKGLKYEIKKVDSKTNDIYVPNLKVWFQFCLNLEFFIQTSFLP